MTTLHTAANISAAAAFDGSALNGQSELAALLKYIPDGSSGTILCLSDWTTIANERQGLLLSYVDNGDDSCTFSGIAIGDEGDGTTFDFIQALATLTISPIPAEFFISHNISAGLGSQLKVNGEALQTTAFANTVFDFSQYVDYSNGCAYLATVSDNTGSLFSAQTGTIEELYVFDGHITEAEHAQFIADGTLPAAAGSSNSNPVANDDANVITAQNTAVTTGNLLANDTDPDVGDTLSIQSASSPNGTIVNNNDGTLTFTPTTDFVGIATVTYVLSDGAGGTDTASFLVGVIPTGFTGGFLASVDASPSLNGMAVGDLWASNDADFTAENDGTLTPEVGAANGDTFQTWFYDASTSTAYTNDWTFNGTDVIDETPDSVTFNAQNAVEPAITIQSNVVTITGIDDGIDISVDVGEYIIDGGSPASAAGAINNNQTLQLQHTSAALGNSVTQTVTVGDTDFTFVSTTRTALVPTVTPGQTFSVDELSPASTVVGTAVSAGEAATAWEIDDADFAISSAGVISSAATLPNYDTEQSRTPSVRAAGADGVFSAWVPITVNFNDVTQSSVDLTGVLNAIAALDAKVTALQSSVASIPTNPLLDDDVRVDDKDGYTLTLAEKQSIATEVEQSILNEADGQQILNAIVGSIGNQNIDEIALVAAIRSDLERAGGYLENLDVANSTRLAASDYSAADVGIVIKRQENRVAFFDANGNPANAYIAVRQVLYDDDGVTPLQTIEYRDAEGNPVTPALAVEIVTL